MRGNRLKARGLYFSDGVEEVVVVPGHGFAADLEDCLERLCEPALILPPGLIPTAPSERVVIHERPRA